MVNFIVEIFSKITFVSLLIFQGIILDMYLVKFHNSRWWAWVVVDILVIVSFIAYMAVLWNAYKRHETNKKNDQEDGDQIDARDPGKAPDELRHAYLLWIIYVVFLIPRVVIIYRRDASTLLERNFLGPNFLKVSVSCTPLIFMLLAYALHDQKQVSARKMFVSSLVGSITLDLFDSIDLLEFLFEPYDQWRFPRNILDSTLAFACINFLLPSLALFAIRINRFDGEAPSLPFKIIYEGSYVLLVNIPNLVIRSVLWHKYNADVSVLIMKNVMCIALGLSEIVKYFGEEKPEKCPKCGRWFEPDFYKQHNKRCFSNHETSRLHAI